VLTFIYKKLFKKKNHKFWQINHKIYIDKKLQYSLSDLHFLMIDNILTGFVPNHQSLMWSQVALAADMALESFLAAMTAAPRFCTVYKSK
jgi:hypothetical protein